MTRLTRERRAVLEHLASLRGDEVTPSQLADAMGRGRGSTRELLRQMARDGLLVSLNRGRYVLRREAPDVPTDSPPDAFTGETDAGESTAFRPREAEIWAYSEADGGMVPNAVLRRRKGYVD